MTKQIICTLVLVISACSVSAEPNQAAKEVNAPAAEAKTAAYVSGGLDEVALPEKNSEAYWVVRSRAVDELISFLTQRRADLKQKLTSFQNYIDKIGMTGDMLKSEIQFTKIEPEARMKALGVFDEAESKGINIPKKPLTWEQLVDLSMRLVVDRGYSPVDMNDEELEGFKNILKRNEQFCMKVRKETSDAADKVVKAWLYLGSIDKQNEFRLYVLELKQQKDAEVAARRAALTEQQRQMRSEQLKTEQQENWQQKQDRRRTVHDEKLENTRERQRSVRDYYNQNGYGDSE
jgi:hypothetical protein